MAGRWVFDCETNGLLPDLTKLHCLALTNLDTRETYSCADQPGFTPIIEGLKILADADVIVGHNIIGFDIPAIQKVYPWWKPKGLVRDTLVLVRLMWPHVKDSDFARAQKGSLPKKLIGSHSLEAWGYRLGVHKDDYTGGWEHWSPAMQEYMDQDIVTGEAIYLRCIREAKLWEVPIEDPNPPPGKDCIELEHRVADIVEQVQNHGIRFDTAGAAALFGQITARRAKLADDVTKVFPPRVVTEIFIPKANNKRYGYEKGVPFKKERVLPFNPASRRDIAERLMELGWKPTDYGKSGVPTVDDEVLQTLPYKEAQILAELFLLDKRLGMLSSGSASWLRKEKNGRLHGRILSGGAHTGRMTHRSPNLAQVPSCSAPWGKECRELFVADHGCVLVGADAEALELRDLAGYMARWDGGAYIKTVLEGCKEDGTDMHTLNAKAIGCSRDDAKVFFYAMIYGAGDTKLGSILGATKNAAKVGSEAKAKLMAAVPALGSLVKAVGNTTARGYIRGLDGRRLKARSVNAALNTLLQSAGAIQMKRALVILWDSLHGDKGWTFGKEFAISLLVHDEWQANVLPELADEYGEAACESIRAAGRYYNFACPLEAQYKVGKTWAETH